MRESMSRLPRSVQPFLTWLTAVPSEFELNNWDGRAPHPIHHLMTALLKLVAGTALSAVFVFSVMRAGGDEHAPFDLAWSVLCLATGFILTTSGLRKLQVVIYHNCAHNMMFDGKAANRFLGTAISIALLIKNFDQYQAAHRLHHSPKHLLTRSDDTLAFLEDQIGLRPSDTIRGMWLKLAMTVFSPLYHARMALGRISSCLLTPGTRVSWLAIGVWSVIVYGAVRLDAVDLLVVTWLAPAFVGYQMSVAVRLCAEHRWPSPEQMEHRDRDFIASSTTSVFMGEALRQREGLIGQGVELVRWAFKMLFVHLFFRVFVMVGDTPCHDFHHRRAASPLWTNYPLARARDKRNGCAGFNINYIDSWGLVRTITDNFRSFKALESTHGGKPA